jgi:hypothetical protein
MPHKTDAGPQDYIQNILHFTFYFNAEQILKIKKSEVVSVNKKS